MKTRLLSFLFFALIWIGTDARAECQNLRLDAPGESMAQIPVRNQRNLGTCFAYASAGAFDAFRASHDKTWSPSKGFTDPIYVSFLENKKNPEYDKDGNLVPWNSNHIDIESGRAFTALQILTETPACIVGPDGRTIVDRISDRSGSEDRQFFLNLIDTYVKGRKLVNDEQYEELRVESSHVQVAPIDVTLVASNSYQNSSPAVDPVVAQIKAIREDLKKQLKAEVNQSSSCVIGGLSTAEKTNLIDSFYQDLSVNLDPSEALAKILFGRCKMAAPIACKNPVRVEHAVDTSKEGLRNFLENSFKPRKGIPTQPVVAEICGDLLRNGPGYDGLGRKPGSEIITKQDKDGNIACGKHVVMVIGSREKSGKCEYLVRNSWGKCIPGTKWPCDNTKSNQWVSSESFLKNTIQFEHLQEN